MGLQGSQNCPLTILINDHILTSCEKGSSGLLGLEKEGVNGVREAGPSWTNSSLSSQEPRTGARDELLPTPSGPGLGALVMRE